METHSRHVFWKIREGHIRPGEIRQISYLFFQIKKSAVSSLKFHLSSLEAYHLGKSQEVNLEIRKIGIYSSWAD